ncbi:hypothetical protein FRC10_010022, partial [Ceratobasidium sp. 414]
MSDHDDIERFLTSLPIPLPVAEIQQATIKTIYRFINEAVRNVSAMHEDALRALCAAEGRPYFRTTPSDPDIEYFPMDFLTKSSPSVMGASVTSAPQWLDLIQEDAKEQIQIQLDDPDFQPFRTPNNDDLASNPIDPAESEFIGDVRTSGLIPTGLPSFLTEFLQTLARATTALGPGATRVLLAFRLASIGLVAFVVAPMALDVIGKCQTSTASHDEI